MAKIKYFKSDSPSSRTIEIYARGPKVSLPSGEKEYPSAEIGLTKGEYEYGTGHGSEYDPFRISHNRLAEPGDQLKLFDAKPSIISYAMADHRMRAYTPTIIGMAINEANKLGMGLTYSSNLSKHSAKLAKKGIELGVVSPNEFNPEAEKRNDIGIDGLGSFEHTFASYSFRDMDKVKGDEVKAGRETIRGITRQSLNARKSHMGEQFEDRQMKLPGF